MAGWNVYAIPLAVLVFGTVLIEKFLQIKPLQELYRII
jgi:hypothetical protein